MISSRQADSCSGDRPTTEVAILTRKLTRDCVLGAAVVRPVRGVDLQICRNEFTAIMEPSGSGKSTLTNLLGCLDTAISGEYWLNSQKGGERHD
ncbi:MAG: hypothetical protein JSV41_03015 [Gemmatimonadota bacterium]|nr:MAG: hypothetical protein JSV41_03015 [Gemmatimonadota bacterium]